MQDRFSLSLSLSFFYSLSFHNCLTPFSLPLCLCLSCTLYLHESFSFPLSLPPSLCPSVVFLALLSPLSLTLHVSHSLPFTSSNFLFLSSARSLYPLHLVPSFSSPSSHPLLHPLFLSIPSSGERGRRHVFRPSFVLLPPGATGKHGMQADWILEFDALCSGFFTQSKKTTLPTSPCCMG